MLSIANCNKLEIIFRIGPNRPQTVQKASACIFKMICICKAITYFINTASVAFEVHSTVFGVVELDSYSISVEPCVGLEFIQQCLAADILNIFQRWQEIHS
jgi:hypothetical protein